jgi:hypothetical protein
VEHVGNSKRPPLTQEAFPFEARLAWMSLSPEAQDAILEVAWCAHCSAETPLTILGGELKSGGLLLRGKCVRCQGGIARFVEEIRR